MQQNDNNILIYQDDNGITKVNVRFSDEDVWPTQAQLAEKYDTTQDNISMRIKNIYKDAELQENRTYKDFLSVVRNVRTTDKLELTRKTCKLKKATLYVLHFQLS